MTTPTTHYSFQKPVVGGSADTWGTENNACWDAVDTALYGLSQTVAGNATPTGAVMDFLMGTAPAGWLALNGSTIGDASSGAGHGNADAQALFGVLWGLSSLTVKASVANGGAAVTRSGDAATDWGLHRQLVLPDLSGLFRRMTGGNAGALGAVQTDALKNHTHGITIPQGTNFSNGNFLQPNGRAQDIAAFYTGTTDVGGGGVETRPVNIAVLTCIKL